MKRFIAIVITVLILFGCSSASNKKNVDGSQSSKNELLINNGTNKFPKTKLKFEELKFIHTFVNSNGEVLGRLYGKEIVDSTFSDFLIVKEINGKFIPIYVIEKATFQNTSGKENIPINNEDFYGYNVLVTVNDNMDIEPLFKIKGKILKGDPVTVKWDENDKMFKVLIAP